MKTTLQRFPISVLMGMVLLIVSCGTTQQAADTDADIAAIESLAEQVKDAYIARDWERFSGFFTEDGVWMPGNRMPLIGKDAWWSFIQRGWERSSVEQMDVSSEEIVVAGDWAFERHNETTTSKVKESGETRQRYYKGIWILQRQEDNSWKIARYIWNRNPDPNAED